MFFNYSNTECKMTDFPISRVVDHKWRDNVLFFYVYSPGEESSGQWVRDEFVRSNPFVKKYKTENNLYQELTPRGAIKNKKIAEIVGIYQGKTKNDSIHYVVRTEGETQYIIVSSEELQKEHSEELIDFLESSIDLD